jgi:hypothetical protein
MQYFINTSIASTVKLNNLHMIFSLLALSYIQVNV